MRFAVALSSDVGVPRNDDLDADSLEFFLVCLANLVIRDQDVDLGNVADIEAVIPSDFVTGGDGNHHAGRLGDHHLIDDGLLENRACKSAFDADSANPDDTFGGIILF